MARSPNYPTKSLETSFEQALNAYNSIGTTSVSSDTFCEALGYSGKNGASLSAIAAVRQYGLIEGRGEDIQISTLFQKIFRPLNEVERYQGLREASLKPKVFAEIFSEYENLPPENLLASIAIRKFGFSEAGAKKFSRSITETYKYVEAAKPKEFIEEADSSTSNTDDATEESAASNVPDQQIKKPIDIEQPLLETGNNSLKFKLSKDVSVSLAFTGSINSIMLDRLIGHLNLTKDIYEE